MRGAGINRDKPRTTITDGWGALVGGGSHEAQHKARKAAAARRRRRWLFIGSFR